MTSALVSFTKFIELKVEKGVSSKKELMFVDVIAGLGNGRPRNPATTPGRSKRFLSLSQFPDWLWDPHILPSGRCRVEATGVRTSDFTSACSTRRRGEVHAAFWWGNVRERGHLEDPGVDGRIILRWIYRKWNGGMD